MISVRVDAKEVRRAFDEDVDAMVAAVERAEQVAADLVADQARRLAPTRSGRLRRSVRVDQRQAVAGGSLAPYAGVVEYGRRRPYMRAQPFMSAAARQVESRVVDVFDQAVDRTVEA